MAAAPLQPTLPTWCKSSEIIAGLALGQVAGGRREAGKIFPMHDGIIARNPSFSFLMVVAAARDNGKKCFHWWTLIW